MDLERSDLKLEISEKRKLIYDDPEIYTVDDVLTHQECDHFINLSKDELKPSLVSDGKGGFVSKGRTSTNAWISHDTDSITSSIVKRIANIINMPTENAEKYQIVHYDIGQEYRPHYDSWEHNGSDKTFKCMEKGGARLITTLIYLNDVEEGGGTYMTKLDKTILPKKGKLLVFSNTYKDSHNRHPLSEHAGLPVIKGEKYIFNLWFRECNRYKLYKEVNPEYFTKHNTVHDSSKTEDSINIEEVVLPPKPPLNTGNMIDLDSLDIDEKTKEKIKNDIVNQLNRKKEKQQIKPEPIKKFDFYLENGDYFPLVTLHLASGNKKEVYNFVDDNEFIIIHVKNIEQITNIVKHPQFNYIIIYHEGSPNNNIKNMATQDKTLFNMFEEKDGKIGVYLFTPNRKMYKNFTIENIDELNNAKIVKSNINKSNIPYLLIENVFSDELLKKILDFYDNNSSKYIQHYTQTKNRLHVHPDKELEIELDNKLSRSVYPEIKKVFYFDVKYRENYKICSYNAETMGRFHPHRDTPHPYQHRRYAMSIFLNDGYEGGEFELPEYNFKIVPKANSALVFPGISSHKVNLVTKGSRKVIITFLCNEIEGKTKNNTAYSVKSDFFKSHNVKYGPIFPF